MKKAYLLYSFCFVIVQAHLLFSDDILMSAQTGVGQVDAMRSLNGTVVPYPIRGVFPDGTIQQGITNRQNKVMPPARTQPILAHGHFSVLPIKNGEYKNFPAGATLFGSYGGVSSSFDTMINLFHAQPLHVTFLRKVHINALHALYHYLMGIYVNFNLQHAGIKQSANGTLFVHVPLFLNDELEYATNKKTLIINHLMNIVQSQFNNAFRCYVPKLPQMYACYLGKTLIQNDYSIDLTLFTTSQLSGDAEQIKLDYIQSLATYLTFYQNFTALLLEQSKTKPSFTAFEQVAESINQFLYQNAKASDDLFAVAVAKMNPPIFSYTYDDVRALKLIPYLAQNLPAQTKKIGWPDQIVAAAQQGIVIDQPGHKLHPIAYFRTASGLVVQDPAADKSTQLFVSMRTGQNLFEEALIPEPDWLSSWSGIVRILRACFGDASALVGLGILDPLMEYIIQIAVEVQKGGSIDSIDATACLQFVQTLKNAMVQSQSSVNQSSLPNLTSSVLDNSVPLPDATSLPVSNVSVPPSDLPVSTVVGV